MPALSQPATASRWQPLRCVSREARARQHHEEAMSKWIAVPQPKAELTKEKEEPELRDDGAKIYFWRTKYGVRYAEIVEPTTFVLWLQEVP